MEKDLNDKISFYCIGHKSITMTKIEPRSYNRKDKQFRRKSCLIETCDKYPYFNYKC